MPRGISSVARRARLESQQWRRYSFGGRDDSNQSDSSDSSSDSDSSDSDPSLLVLDSPETFDGRSQSPDSFNWHSDASSASSNHSNNSNHSEQSNHSNSDSENSHIDNQSDSDVPDIPDSASSISVGISWRSNNSQRGGSSSDDDNNEDINRIVASPGLTAGYASSGTNSSRSSVDSDDDDDGFNRLRLSLPGTPSDRSPRSERSDSEPENIFGDFLRNFAQRLDSPLESPPTPRAPVSIPTMAPNLRPSTSGTTSSTSTSTISFECSVCLENLDAPASIGDTNVVGGESINVRNGQGPSSSRRGARYTPGNTNATDIAATYCGHMYHQMCLEKWFHEQGKRTCPSCRKNVPKSKLVKLYPNISTEATSGPRNGNDSPGQSLAIASTSKGSTSANGSAGSDGSCGRAECQDMKVIHTTLMNDYSDLQTRFDELRENDQVKEAQLQSLLEDNARKNDEIASLKRSLEESSVRPSSSSSTGAKRRRH